MNVQLVNQGPTSAGLKSSHSDKHLINYAVQYMYMKGNFDSSEAILSCSFGYKLYSYYYM